MSLGIVIAYKSDKGLRARHAMWTVARYKKMFPHAEIILSEDTESTESDWQGFCKSKWINRGVAKTKASMLLITDIDIVLPLSSIMKCMELAKEKAYVLPYNVLYKMTFGTSGKVLSKPPTVDMPNIQLGNQHKVVLKDRHPQGISVLKRENFERVGGYDERFIGWGSEDAVFQRAVLTMCDGGMIQFDGYALHFKHGIVKNRQKERDQRIGYAVQEYREAFMNREKMSEILRKRGVKI